MKPISCEGRIPRCPLTTTGRPWSLQLAKP